MAKQGSVKTITKKTSGIKRDFADPAYPIEGEKVDPAIITGEDVIKILREKGVRI
jgi:hypothetical protein